MQFELLGKVRIEGRRFIVSVGECDIVVFDVADRYISNGHRRPKNNAVHICMNQLGSGYSNCWGSPNTVQSCIEVLDKLGVPMVPFLELLEKLEWGDQFGKVKGQVSFL